jgi:hypothetical protein
MDVTGFKKPRRDDIPVALKHYNLISPVGDVM